MLTMSQQRQVIDILHKVYADGAEDTITIYMDRESANTTDWREICDELHARFGKYFEPEIRNNLQSRNYEIVFHFKADFDRLKFACSIVSYMLDFTAKCMGIGPTSTVSKDCIITGGIIPRLFAVLENQGELEDLGSGDVDVFVISRGDRLKKMIEGYTGNDRFHKESDPLYNGEHFDDIYWKRTKLFDQELTLQLIFMKNCTCGGDVVANFDYKHLQGWFDPSTSQLWLNDEQIHCIMNKKLVLTPDRKHNMSRRSKYMKRGYRE